MPDRNLVSGLGGTVIVGGRCNTQIYPREILCKYDRDL